MPVSSHDSQSAQIEQVIHTGSASEWEDLLTLLPANALEQGREHKAFVRARGLRHPGDLLRGILAYVFCLTSFHQVGAWAASIGLCGNAERSWAKRTRQAAAWLLWLRQALLLPAPIEQVRLPQGFAERIHLLDATHLRTWKRSGESRRLHISYDLFGQRLEEVLLTDHHVGERLGHFHPKPGDIEVAESAYCRRGAIFTAVDAQVQVVVRLHWANVPLQEEDGSPFDLSAWLKELEQQGGQGEHAVWIELKERRLRLRLLAKRLSEEAAKRAHRRRKTKARKQGHTNRPLTVQVADWLLVLTSLAQQHWSIEVVLALYRARWQIELLFKRIKELVRLHRLRSNPLQSNQAVLAALLVGWALMEQQARRLRQQLALAQHEEPAEPISSWQVCAVLDFRACAR